MIERGDLLININELSVFRGKDIPIGKGITIHQPSLGAIDDYGEEEYFSMVRGIVATPSDLIYQLSQLNQDFTQISEYELFYRLLCWNLNTERTSILFGPKVNFSTMRVYENPEINEVFLLSDDGEVLINKYIYASMTEILRSMHGIKKNIDMPGNEFSKKMMIEEAEDDYLINKDKPYQTNLLPLISTMVVKEGFKHDEVTVFDMKIAPFIDAVKRSSHNKKADLYLQSGYSGFGISLKDIDAKAIDYFSRL